MAGSDEERACLSAQWRAKLWVMRWGLLRIILLIINAAIFAGLAYLFATAPIFPLDTQGWFAMGVMIFSALNFFYILRVNPFSK
jgi:hypothetical protein